MAQIDRGRSAERRPESGSREGSCVPVIAFACSGEVWTIGREGVRFSLRDTKGLTYIQRLLQHPGEEFHALDLLNGPGIAASSAVDSEETVAQLRERPDVTVREIGDAGEMLDEQAKLEYKRRLQELTEQLEDIRERGAHERADVVESEIDSIQHEVARAVGLGGRNRRAGSAAERARLNVTRAIKSVIEKIAERDSALGKLLDRSIRTGSFCSYVPDSLNPTNWRFSLSLESELLDGEAATHPTAKGMGRSLRKHWHGGVFSLAGLALIAAVILIVQHLSLRPPITTASIPTTQSSALPLPDKPSIAVLPFTNMSGYRDQEYFSDGITEDLITALSKLPVLFVIARNSTFTYKGKAVKVQQVGRELGVHYVLEGSVRKAGNHVRVTAQLADATTGDHVWAERYDRPLQDIFAVQDSIVQRIVTTLNLEFTLVHQGWQFERHTDNAEAYDDALRGLGYLQIPTKEATLKAQQMFEKAIELDPKYASAYGDLGAIYLIDWVAQWSNDPSTLDRALHFEQQAIALDDSLDEAHRVLAETYLWKKQYDEATAEAQRAIALDPNSADSCVVLADIMDFSGKPAEAVSMAEKAMRLDPQNREGYLLQEGWSYTQMGRYADAIPILKRHLARYPINGGAHMLLIVDYIELGREQEARAEAAEVRRIAPWFSLEVWAQRSPQKNRALLERNLADARKAGLK